MNFFELHRDFFGLNVDFFKLHENIFELDMTDNEGAAHWKCHMGKKSDHLRFHIQVEFSNLTSFAKSFFSKYSEIWLLSTSIYENFSITN